LAFTISNILSSSSANELTSDKLKTVVGDGGANSLDFSSHYLTSTGSVCSSCDFCSGSRLGFLFDPNMQGICIDCGTIDNDCNRFRVITTFDKAWNLWFFSQVSSKVSAAYDPIRIILEGSNSYNGVVGSNNNTWSTIFDSDDHSGLQFSKRGIGKDFVFNNEKEFKTYAITYVRNPGSSKLQLGRYGIVQAYTKQVAAKIYENIKGTNLLAPLTSAPTDTPTKSPTKDPTSAPTDTPTKSPTKNPTSSPTNKPTKPPTRNPTRSPTPAPTTFRSVLPISFYDKQLKSMSNNQCMYWDNYGDMYSGTCTNKNSKFQYNPTTGEIKATYGDRAGLCLLADGWFWPKLRSCDGKEKQKFEFSDGRIKTTNSNKCLFLNGNRFIFQDCAPNKNEIFQIVSTGSTQLKTTSNNKCMYWDQYGDVYSGNCASQNNKFQYNAKTGEIKATYGGSAGLCLLADGWFWPKLRPCDGKDKQKFQFSDGRIKTTNSNKCLDFLGTTRFVFQDCVANGNEKFQIIYY